MHTLIYTKTNDQDKVKPKLQELRTNPKDRASARVVEFWQGEVERCDMMLYGDGCDKVAEAYKVAGIDVKALFEKPKKVEIVTQVEVAPVTEATPEPIVEIKEQESIASPIEPTPQLDLPKRGRPRKE